MNISRLRLVTFDVTNTILQFRNTPGKQYGEIGAMFGVLCDRDTLATNFKVHWRKMNKEHPNFGQVSGIGWEKWWKMLVFGTFKDANFEIEDKKLDAISTHLIDAYKTSACWQQSYGALGLLSYLRNRGMYLGVVSNFDVRLNELLQNTKLRHYFKFVVTSYEAGFEKPDQKIFHEAIKLSQLTNLKSEECLHVGDTPLLDYVGAKNAGWNAALIYDSDIGILKDKYPAVDEDNVYRNLYELHKYFVDFDDMQTGGKKM